MNRMKDKMREASDNCEDKTQKNLLLINKNILM